MDNKLAERKAAAVRKAIQQRLRTEFDTMKEAADAIGVPSSTMNRHFSPTTEHPSKDVPLTFIVQVADWLHVHRGHEDFAMLWRNVTKDIQ